MEGITNFLADMQSFGVSYYLNRPNKKNIGVVYARFRIGGKLYRISTKLRSKAEYWDKSTGDIRLKREGVSRVDWTIHNIVSRELNNISNVVNEKIEYYLCDCANPVSSDVMGSELAKLVNREFKMSKKREPSKISLIAKRKGIVLDYDNIKTQNSFLGIVATFEKFLKANGIADSIENMNQDTMREWRKWLENEKYSVSRVKDCFNQLFTFAKKLEQKYDYDFKLNKGKIEPIKDKRSVEEKRSNGIALTPVEVGKLRDIDLTGKEDLQPIRDMFLLQCYCGCRVDDLPLLLDSSHISRDSDGHYYSTFKTQKKGITSITPLTSLYPMAWQLVERYKDNCPFVSRADFAKYNRQIKLLAKLVGLDREITKTKQNGKDKTVGKFHVYDKLSSHDGRRTFITNCIREKGLTPDKIKLISGHTDTKLIETTYANLTQEDNKKILSEAIQEANTGNTNTGDTTHREPKSDGVKDPVQFALWLCSVLGVVVESGKISLPELFTRIKDKKQEIISTYGAKRYGEIKSYIGEVMSEADKKRLEVLFCRAMNRPVKVVGKIPKRFKW